jgi:multimeric flavodoxin WrbA
MLIVALNGSPHREGNTACLLNEALRTVRNAGVETALLHVGESLASVKVPFCQCCSTPCEGTCYRGTLLSEMLDLLRRADGVIMGSPVYFGTASGQIKSFWDKTRRLRSEKALIDVIGGCIAVGSSRYGGQETTLRALQDMMLSQGMTVVGDGCADDDAGHRGACGQRPAQDDREALMRAGILAKRVFTVAVATAGLRQYKSR